MSGLDNSFYNPCKQMLRPITEFIKFGNQGQIYFELLRYTI